MKTKTKLSTLQPLPLKEDVLLHKTDSGTSIASSTPFSSSAYKNEDDVYNDNDKEEEEEEEGVDDKKGKKKKKRKPWYPTIHVEHTKHAVVLRAAEQCHLRRTYDENKSTLIWMDAPLTLSRFFLVHPWQRINHFPGMHQLCHKQRLAKNLSKMQLQFPLEYRFWPWTWCMAFEDGKFKWYALQQWKKMESQKRKKKKKKEKEKKWFIAKPESKSRGIGIYVFSHPDEFLVDSEYPMIVQKYIEKPYLIDGYKFDLRVYALITQCDPLHVYVYQEGIARFATEPYVPPNETNQSNLCMHLTNYAVNKKSKHFLDGGKEEGSKRSMTWVWKYLDAQGLDGQGVWQKIKDIIVKSVLIVAPEIKRLIRRCFPHMQESVCFELLGFDILLDRKLTPYVLEINHSPSLSCDTSLDHALKQTMLEELFQVLHLDSLNPQKWRHQERVEAQQRLYPTSSMASPPFSGASTSSLHPPSLPTPPTVSFELIYPPTSPSLLHQYSLFLNHAEHLARVPDTLASSHRKQTRPSPSVLKPRLPPLPFMDPSAGPNSSEVDLKKKPSSTHVVTKKSGSCPSVSSNLTSTSTHAATHPLKVERKVFQLHVPACETWL